MLLRLLLLCCPPVLLLQISKPLGAPLPLHYGCGCCHTAPADTPAEALTGSEDSGATIDHARPADDSLEGEEEGEEEGDFCANEAAMMQYEQMVAGRHGVYSMHV